MAQPTVFDRILRPNVKGWRELQRALELLQGVSAEFFNNLTGDPTSYTPTWTSASGTPAIGNGTMTGSYFRFFRWCFASIHMTWGGTTSNGSGAYSWSLPIDPLTDFTWVGTGFFIDASLGPNTAYILTPFIDLTTGLLASYLEASPTRLGSSNPAVKATGDQIVLKIGYPVEEEA